MFVLLCVHVSCMWVHTPEGISMWNTEIDLHILSRVINLSFGDTVSLWLGWGSLIQPDWLAKDSRFGSPMFWDSKHSPILPCSGSGVTLMSSSLQGKNFPKYPWKCPFQ